ncbi:ribokinase [Lunatibacter salilacus]|uniref:ribokinase n=1 Tax=Lunatibacter salilacus TaxID=2483804 RepID=UPI00131DBF75|nr:ribokinase [Lunatibacter salilacus]
MTKPGNITVVGSANTDMVILADHFPSPGETILGGKFLMNPGGKGANQAVAAARLGGNVTFISRVGDDIFGQETCQHLQKEGIDTQGLHKHPSLPSGVALITVDKNGENTIVVASGANMSLTPDELARHLPLIQSCEILLMQLEIPMESVLFAAKSAFQQGKKVILNPAPAAVLPMELYPYVYAITPNETETTQITGIKVTDETSAKKAAEKLISLGVQNVVITLGAAGAYLHSKDLHQIIPAPKVDAVDSTAAGDTFNGGLAVALAEGMDWVTAVTFANRAAALSVTQMGAQASIPLRQAVVERYG